MKFKKGMESFIKFAPPEKLTHERQIIEELDNIIKIKSDKSAIKTKTSMFVRIFHRFKKIEILKAILKIFVAFVKLTTLRYCYSTFMPLLIKNTRNYFTETYGFADVGYSYPFALAYFVVGIISCIGVIGWWATLATAAEYRELFHLYSKGHLDLNKMYVVSSKSLSTAKSMKKVKSLSPVKKSLSKVKSLSPVIKSLSKVKSLSPVKKSLSPVKSLTKVKSKKCPKGTRKNKKTGLCEAKN